MHELVFLVFALSPSVVFSLLALPVDKYRPGHQATLIIVYIANLIIPVLHAGQYSRTTNNFIGNVTFVSGLKMAVWLFCMPQEERRKRPYYVNFWYWRERRRQQQQQQDKNTAAAGSQSVPDLSISQAIKTYLKLQLCFELLAVALKAFDQQQSIQVFWYMVHRVLGQPTEDHFSIQAIAASFMLSILFAACLQYMIQTTYNIFMIGFCVMYHLLPGHAGFRKYVEGLMAMSSVFDSPWEATSLRDYWSNRWQQFYNMSFYRLAFQPVRRICDALPLLKPFRRVLPTLTVFAFSGVMHEYFLYCGSGPEKYWQERIGGLQLLFFLLQPVGLMLSDKWFSSGVRGRVFAFAWMIGCSHLFVVPYLVTNHIDTSTVEVLPTVIRNVAKLLTRVSAATAEMSAFRINR